MTDKPEKSAQQKLYEQVMRAPEHAVLARMRLLGFWPSGHGLPQDPPEEAKERAILEKEKAALIATALGPVDVDEALRKENQRRILEARQRRKERALAREKNRAKRRIDWLEHARSHVVHAGVGVSAGLSDAKSNEQRLIECQIPILHDAADVARLLSLSLGELRYLTYHRRGAALVHYHRYEIPKKAGGVRRISAPRKKLAAAQRCVLESILEKIALEGVAHGFVRHRSILTNATQHVGKSIVVNLDLKDFFPTITFRRVKGMFRGFGYSEQVATVLGLLTTEPPRMPVVLDGERIWVALGERVLPQGACTSPAITNILCRRLDRRLEGIARRHGFRYTRYADDLTFSGSDRGALGHLLGNVRRVIGEEGFFENEAKARAMGRGSRQEVTGVVVNERVTVSRKEVRRLRAMLHNARVHGLESQNRAGHPSFLAHLRGRIAFVAMVDPKKAEPLQQALEALLSS